MDMIMKLRFNAMLALGLFKPKRGKAGNHMEIQPDGTVTKWGYKPVIKHIDELDKTYLTNRQQVDTFYTERG